MEKFRLLGDLRIGQAIIGALVSSGHLTQQGASWNEIPTSYAVTGKDLYYMEDAELIKILRDYIVGLERQDMERKAKQGKEASGVRCRCISPHLHKLP